MSKLHKHFNLNTYKVPILFLKIYNSFELCLTFDVCIAFQRLKKTQIQTTVK